MADTFAVMLAGAGSEVAPPLLRYVEQTGERGASPILGSGRTASPEMAALVNGTFGHALDFDDVLSMMPAHPSAVILPALMCRSAGGNTFRPGPDRGLRHGCGGRRQDRARRSPSATTTGASTAPARSPSSPRWGRCQTLPSRRADDTDGVWHRLLAGERVAAQLRHDDQAPAYRLGVAQCPGAVNLARSGFTAAPDVLEAPAGFFAAYGVEESCPEAAINRLGNPWVIARPGLALKRFPCCYASHRGMDGVLQLRQRLGLNAANLARLECRMPPGGMRVLIYPQPKTGLEGKFSLQYALAAGVLDWTYTLWSFTDEAVHRAPIRDLLARICVREDPRCADNDPLLETRSSGSRGFVEVEAMLKDGRRETVRVDQAPGHPARELT